MSNSQNGHIYTFTIWLYDVHWNCTAWTNGSAPDEKVWLKQGLQAMHLSDWRECSLDPPLLTHI